MSPVQKCFSVLANELRVNILRALKERSLSVNELAEKLNKERSSVSHSLSKLKECNFVESEKKGKKRVYSLSTCIVNDMKKTRNIFELMEYHIKYHCKGKCEVKK